MILFNQKDIERKIFSISKELNNLYPKTTKNLVLCPILQGATPFFVDISKCLHFDVPIEYIGIKSYEGVTQGDFDLYKMPDPELFSGKIVWLFDDLVDSGKTLEFLGTLLLKGGAAQVKTCVLLKKKHCAFIPDIHGFEIGTEWVWGYGMDSPEGNGRGLNNIYCDIPFV